MATADDYNRMIGDHTNPLVKATDDAIAEENARLERSLMDYDARVEYERREQENAVRWGAILGAEQVVGEHGIVIPMAVAREIVQALQGEPTSNEMLTPGLLAAMVLDHIVKQESK